MSNPVRKSVKPEQTAFDTDTEIGRALAWLKTAAIAVYGALQGGSTAEEDQTVYSCLWNAIEKLEGEIVTKYKKESPAQGQ
jgi:hypothetical protein